MLNPFREHPELILHGAHPLNAEPPLPKLRATYPTHSRFAVRLDDRYEFVAGALSSAPERATRSAAALGLPDPTPTSP